MNYLDRVACNKFLSVNPRKVPITLIKTVLYNKFVKNKKNNVVGFKWLTHQDAVDAD